MELHIYRDLEDDDSQGQFGRAVLDEHKEWVCVELPNRGNVHDKSCVPPLNRGEVVRYNAQMSWSNRHTRALYHLLDVPGRGDIEMHSANWAGDADKGWYSELLGCIALGKAKAQMQPPPDGIVPRKPQWAITSSAIAMAEFQAATGGGPLVVVIHAPVLPEVQQPQGESA